jgi:hypothetical protein
LRSLVIVVDVPLCRVAIEDDQIRLVRPFLFRVAYGEAVVGVYLGRGRLDVLDLLDWGREVELFPVHYKFSVVYYLKSYGLKGCDFNYIFK